MKRWALLLPSLVLVLSLGCRKEPPRPKVVNPMIDSAEKFVTVYTESLPPPETGLDAFLGILRSRESTGRVDSAQPDSTGERQGLDPSPASAGERKRPETPRRSAAAGERVVTLRPDTTEPAHDPGTVEMTGTIRHVGVEGGFWGITGDNGQKYDPLNLPEELQQAGLKLKFWVRIRKDIATTHMWGTPVQIVRYVVPAKSREP